MRSSTREDGLMFDLATDSHSIALIRQFWESAKIVSTACHGTAAILNVKLSNSSFLLSNTPVNGFANSEEDETNSSGGKYEKASANWASHVVVAKDGRLLTGRNPESAKNLAKVILNKLNT
ncbi:hypothetical protein N7522_004556 [Penicillium canescens]|nr:hypothetical protein N7522_004556 [Penicillium canescens]